MSNYLISLFKAEDPQAYKRMAEKGMMLAHPVRINGQDKRSDNGMGFHSTIKVFNTDRDHPHAIHALAQHLPLNAPDAKNTQIEPGQFKDRNGNDVFVLKLRGNSADKIKEHNGRFAHMGDPVSYEYAPHISVPKELHDKIKASGAKTAHEAGIEFGHAELKHGPKTLRTYRHEPDTTRPKVPDVGDLESQPHSEPKTDKLAASEKDNLCPLHKGALKNAGIALGMAGALAGSSQGASTHANRSPASIQQPKVQAPAYDHKKMMNAIMQIESSGGKNLNHKPTSTGTAYGKWALMPGTIKDTIKSHKDLKAKYGKALSLNGENLHRYMQDNKGLEDTIADRHLAHVERHFKTPEDIGFAWNQGVTGTNRAKKEGKKISEHPYVQKIKGAYENSR